MELILSLFPGADFLGRAFEASGFSVVRGPDTLWDQRIEDFHCRCPGRFDGIVGGPPCQNYSDANRRRDTSEGDRLVLEFLRLIDEARPSWFLMENVRNVPSVRIAGYSVQRLDITDCACGGRQRSLRHVQFGSQCGDIIRPRRTSEARSNTPRVMTRPTSPHDRHVRRLDRMGAPHLPLRSLTVAARARVVGNGVPWQMGLALAEAVASRGPSTNQDCVCGCGRLRQARGTHATVSCRNRTRQVRRGTGPRVLTYSSAHADS